MKGIKSEQKVGEEKRRNKVIVGGVLIFLMVFSTAGFALFGGGSSTNSDSNSGTGEQEPYNNGQYWIYNLGGRQFYFTNSIDLVQNIPVDITLSLGEYSNSPVFIDAENLAVRDEIAINLDRFAGRLQRGCYGSCEEDIPEKDCSENLIVFVESDEKRVYQEQNCVFIEGDLLSVDAFLYKILSIS